MTDDAETPAIPLVGTGLARPSPPKVGRLTNLRGVRTELRAVYADARQGRIDTQDATRLAYVLQVTAKVLETEALEARLEKLEDLVAVAARSGQTAIRRVA